MITISLSIPNHSGYTAEATFTISEDALADEAVLACFKALEVAGYDKTMLAREFIREGRRNLGD